MSDQDSQSTLDIAARVDANELELETIKSFERLVRGGYKFVNITVRKDGRETTFEGDWLVRLFRWPIANFESLQKAGVQSLSGMMQAGMPIAFEYPIYVPPSETSASAIWCRPPTPEEEAKQRAEAARKAAKEKP